MGCACKASRHIQFIEKKYGTGVRYKQPVHMDIKDVLKKIVAHLLIFLFFPLMVFHVVFVAIFLKNKTVNYYKLFGIKRKKHVGIQQ